MNNAFYHELHGTIFCGFILFEWSFCAPALCLNLFFYNEILMYNVINTQAVFSFLFFNVIPDFSFSFRLFNFIAVQVFLVHFYSLPVMKNKQTKRKTQRLHQWNCACWLGIPLYPHCVISQHNSTRWKTERWTVYLWVSSSVRHNPPHFSETPHLGNV